MVNAAAVISYWRSFLYVRSTIEGRMGRRYFAPRVRARISSDVACQKCMPIPS